MRRYAYAAALVALVGCARSVNMEQERTALMTVDREWSQTTKDLDKFMSYYASDATSYAPGAPATTGTDNIRKSMGGILSAPGTTLSWTATGASVASSGDLGTTAGTYEMSSPAGAEKGKYVTVWKKEGDAWKVSQDIFNSDAAVAAPPAQHALLSPADVKWGDPPPVLPKGARFAVVSGDPSQPVPFVVRLQMPAGYRIAPHWHPTIENVTVLNGAFALGMGEQFDEAKMTALPVGGYATLPAEMRHYAMAKSAATVQVHGTGPFVINYVSPTDDPSKK